jgi:hypothetical protein
MNEFCPSCAANIGAGTFDAIGCPVCDAEPDNLAQDSDDEEEVLSTPVIEDLG